MDSLHPKCKANGPPPGDHRGSPGSCRCGADEVDGGGWPPTSEEDPFPDEIRTALLDQLLHGAAVYRPMDGGRDFRILYMNPAGEAIDGIRIEEIAGKRLTEVFPGVWEFGLLDALREVHRTGLATDLEPRRYSDGNRNGWRKNRIIRLDSMDLLVYYEDLDGVAAAKSEARTHQVQHRELFDQSPVGLYRTAPEGTFLDANPALAKMLGYRDVEDCLKRSAVECYLDPAERERILNRLRKKGTVSETEVPWRRRDGSRIWVNLKGRGIFDRKGELQYIEGSAADVTHEVLGRREKELRHRETRLLLDNIPVQIWYLTDPETYGRVNRAHAQFWGSVPNDMEGAPVSDITRPEWAERLVQCARIAFETGQEQAFMEATRNAQGEDRRLALTITPLRDTAGSPYLVVCSAEDVTTIFEAETRIYELGNCFEKAFQESPHAQTLCSRNGCEFLRINEAFGEMLGYTAEEVIGRSAQELGFMEDADHLLALEQFETGGRLHNFEVTLTHKAGKSIHVLWSAQPVTLSGEDGILCVFEDTTERTIALKTLRESEARLRAISVNAQDAIIQMDTHGTVSFWNPAAEKIFGWTQDEILGKDLHGHLVPKSLQEQARKGLKAFFSTGRGEAAGRTLELTSVRKNGTEIPIEISLAPVFSSDGWMAVGIVRDISERKRNEKQLKDHAEFLDRVINSLNHPFTVIDAESNEILLANDVAMESGPSGASTCFGLTHHADSPCGGDEYPCHLEMVKATGEPCRVQHRLATGDGGYRIVDLYAHPLFNAEGEVSKVIEYGIDVTDRHRATKQLEKIKGELQALFDLSSDAVFIHDGEGRVADLNEAAAKLLGRPVEEVRGQNLATFIPQNHWPILRDAAKNLKRDGTARTELKMVRRHGRLLDVESATAVIDASAGIYQSVVRDVTDRKAMERNIREERDRTHKANGRLKEALRREKEASVRAEEASKAKGEFLANMSHEIRTPLNGVLGMSGLLLDTDLDPEQREYTQTVHRSAEALLAVINDILDFSKIEAGKMEIEEAAFPLRRVIEEVGDLLAFQAQEKGLEFITDIDTELPECVVGDEVRLRQVLLNITGNAIKFTHAGEVRVRACKGDGDGGATAVVFSVQDTGIGIPEEKRSCLFGAFVQADTSTTRKYGGTGLGLAISQRLVEAMGGKITAASRVGEGSTFTFVLPLAASEEDERKIPPGTSSRIGGQRVLVVDDNETNRRLLTKWLEAWGCGFEAVSDGFTALSRLKEAAADGRPFRAVLVDMAMPGMDGEELCRRIRSEDGLSPTSLILLTSAGGNPTANLKQDAPWDAALSKPAKSLKLLHTLSALLAPKPGISKVESSPAHLEPVLVLDGLRILVAEDNPVNQTLLLKMLEKAGAFADAVGDGRQALQVLARASYDLVLMDVQMPEMDGFECTRTIRRGESAVLNPGIPVVAMTAHVMKGDRERCIESGMDDYLTKPVVKRDLLATVGRWTGKSEPLDVPPKRNRIVFDKAGLLERLGGDEETAIEIVQLFLEDASRRIRDIGSAVAAASCDAIRNHAHALKGAAASAGALDVERISAEIEAKPDAPRIDLSALDDALRAYRKEADGAQTPAETRGAEERP